MTFNIEMATAECNTNLQNMLANGNSGSVWEHLSSAVTRGGARKQMTFASQNGWDQEQAINKFTSIFTVRNQAGDFAAGMHDGGAMAMYLCSQVFLKAPGDGGVETPSIPSSNAIDPRTGKKFVPTFEIEEAEFRLLLNVGYRGNAFAPGAVGAGAKEADEFLANPTGPWAVVKPEVLRFVLMEGLDTVKNPYGADMYNLESPQAVLDLQKRLGEPSGNA
jgi:hypothetical protein